MSQILSMSEFLRLEINDDLWIPIGKKQASLEGIEWAHRKIKELLESGKGELVIYPFGKEGGQKVEGLKFSKLFGPTFFVADDFLARISKWGGVKYWPRTPVKENVNP